MNNRCKEYLKAYRKIVGAKDNEKIDKRYKPYLAPDNRYYAGHCGYCAEVKYLLTIYKNQRPQGQERKR